MSLFTPETIGTSDDILSSPHRNNYNKLQTLLNGGLGDDQFADNIITGLKLKDNTVPTGKILQSDWSTWTPTWAGFSAAPTLDYARYIRIGKLVVCQIRTSANGTSNANTFTLTLPVAPRTAAIDILPIHIINNGISGFGHIQMSGGSTTVGVYRITGTDMDNITTFVAWTASGQKGFGTLMIEFSYETA